MAKNDLINFWDETTIEYLQEYIDRVESVFSETSDRERKEMFGEEKYIEGFSYKHWDPIARLDESFPNLFRRSLFITIYASAESRLIEICWKVKRRYHKPEMPLTNQNILSAGLEYIQSTMKYKFDPPSVAWDDICKYREIRNSIVHRGSKINFDRNKVLENYITGRQDIWVDNYNYLHLDKGFVINEVNNFYSFFDALKTWLIDQENCPEIFFE
jgi:hypothetical protein